MTNSPSGRRLEMLERVAREEAKDRLRISWIQVAASLILMASTLLAWENHPRVEYRGGAHPGFYIVEVSHSMGLVTRPAGILVIAIGAISLAGAKLLQKVHLRYGWLALVFALGALATCAVEIVQLLLGRRNWLDSVTNATGPSLLGQAIGIGVWLAALASVALVANTS